MAFFDRFKKWYLVKVRCYNCGHTQDCKVPKGMTIDSHLKTEAAMCENCGNPTLRRIERVSAPPGAQEPLREVMPPRKGRYPTLPPLAPRRVPAQRPPRPVYRAPTSLPKRPVPQRRPSRRQYTDDNYVQYPVTEPVPVQEEEEKDYPQPDWSLRPKKINLWTGREEGQ